MTSHQMATRICEFATNSPRISENLVPKNNIESPKRLSIAKMNNTNNNCRFCLRIFEELEERIGITSQISDEFRNITQTEVKNKQKIIIAIFNNILDPLVHSSVIYI